MLFLLFIVSSYSLLLNHDGNKIYIYNDNNIEFDIMEKTCDHYNIIECCKDVSITHYADNKLYETITYDYYEKYITKEQNTTITSFSSMKWSNNYKIIKLTNSTYRIFYPNLLMSNVNISLGNSSQNIIINKKTYTITGLTQSIPNNVMYYMLSFFIFNNDNLCTTDKLRNYYTCITIITLCFSAIVICFVCFVVTRIKNKLKDINDKKTQISLSDIFDNMPPRIFNEEKMYSGIHYKKTRRSSEPIKFDQLYGDNNVSLGVMFTKNVSLPPSNTPSNNSKPQSREGWTPADNTPSRTPVQIKRSLSDIMIENKKN